RTGEKVDQAEMLRLKGETLLMQDPGMIDQAEAWFRAALEVARAQEAKWWELRASVNLARLLRDTNRRDGARDARRHVRLVHRGFRPARSERRQGAARGIKMKCAKCSAENRQGRKFCAKCAAPLARLCPRCGAQNQPDEDFCGECAAPLAQTPGASAK